MAALKNRFDILVRAWKRKTRFTSSITEMVTLSEYQEIISMGFIAVPFILAELQQESDHWFWALRVLTGENPCDLDDAGKIAIMRDKWLQWGRDNNLL